MCIYICVCAHGVYFYIWLLLILSLVFLVFIIIIIISTIATVMVTVPISYFYHDCSGHSTEIYGYIYISLSLSLFPLFFPLSNSSVHTGRDRGYRIAFIWPFVLDSTLLLKDNTAFSLCVCSLPFLSTSWSRCLIWDCTRSVTWDCVTEGCWLSGMYTISLNFRRACGPAA